MIVPGNYFVIISARMVSQDSPGKLCLHVFWPVFTRLFFLFAPCGWPPLFLPFLSAFSPFFPSRKDLWECLQKSLITDTDSLLNSNYFPLQIKNSGSKQINSVIISATTVVLKRALLDLLVKTLDILINYPKRPKIEKFQDRPPGLKFSISKRATQQTPIFFCGEFWRSGLKFSIEIEIFNRDWKIQARLIFFNLWALRVLSIWKREFAWISWYWLGGRDMSEGNKALTKKWVLKTSWGVPRSGGFAIFGVSRWSPFMKFRSGVHGTRIENS